MSLEEDKKKIIFPSKEEAKELIGKLQKDMKSDEQYSAEDFDRHFKNRRADYPLSTYGIVGVNRFVSDNLSYDVNRQFDVRRMIAVTQTKNDKELMRDVCLHVGERFVNCEPDSDMTLKQFATILASRLIAVGF